eukprot:m.95087 g.95087  ORF g.95087 m.95087 type:complete len:50 (+) comp12315_c0_seq2:384-533(+)
MLSERLSNTPNIRYRHVTDTTLSTSYTWAGALLCTFVTKLVPKHADIII